MKTFHVHLAISPFTGFLCKLQNSIFQWKAVASMIFHVILISLAEVDEILASEITPHFSFFCMTFEFSFSSRRNLTLVFNGKDICELDLLNIIHTNSSIFSKY